MQSIPMISPPSIMMNSGLSAGSSPPLNADVAGEFETLMLSQLLKQMRSSEDGGLFPGDETDTYGGMFDMYFGRFLAENGGLGLADFVTKGLDQSQAVNASESNPEVLPELNELSEQQER